MLNHHPEDRTMRTPLLLSLLTLGACASPLPAQSRREPAVRLATIIWAAVLSGLVSCSAAW